MRNVLFYVWVALTVLFVSKLNADTLEQFLVDELAHPPVYEISDSASIDSVTFEQRYRGIKGTIHHEAGESVIGNLDVDHGGSSFHMHGGDLSIGSVKFDDGDFLMRGGSLSIGSFSMGDPPRVLEEWNQPFWLNSPPGGGPITIDPPRSGPVELLGLEIQAEEGILTRGKSAAPFAFFIPNPTRPGNVILGVLAAPVIIDGPTQLDIMVSADASIGDVTAVWGGVVRSPKFEQTGGAVSIAEDLALCIPSGVVITNDAAAGLGTIRYELSGGTLQVGGNLIVGSAGTTPVRFEQSGDTVAVVEGEIQVGGGASAYNLQGGSVEVTHLNLQQSGEFIVSENATLSADRITLHADSELRGIGSPEVTLHGDLLFESRWVERPKLDLANLNFVVSPEADSVASLEVAGENRGTSAAAWVDNIVLDTLTIQGGEGSGTVKLSDEFKNTGLDAESEERSNEAFYVETLVLADSAVFDLNGQQIFFRELSMGEGVQVLNISSDCNGDGETSVTDLDCMTLLTQDRMLADLDLLRGDLNGDGTVAFDDFLALSANFGDSVDSYSKGDIDLNGTVGFTDFLELSKNFGRESSAVAVVPEPNSFCLAICSLVLFSARRRRLRSR